MLLINHAGSPESRKDPFFTTTADAQNLLSQGAQMRNEMVIQAMYPLEQMLDYLNKQTD
ncbi:hypothetical protein [Xenorhabdus cabanillasii]|uniref:hypothetical protein n=1 Tax=Xenorhabdus cabanillasii TaxID=351673 RepID=UPI001475A0CA|nr:hypothetical protein [Xenorhabdus cabanillasii]